jgi:hypothetical protein
MANTYTLIASSTVGSGGASTIDFSSIPSTYTDLMLLVSTRTTIAFLDIQLNASTSNRSSLYLYGTGSATGSGSQAGYLGVTSYSSDTANTFGSMSIYIPNYASTTTYKSFSTDTVRENNATSGEQDLVASLWSSNSAVNQITIYPESSGTFVQYSTAYLYGISNS